MNQGIFLLAVAVLLFAICVSAHAQQPKRTPRIGYLSARDRSADAVRADAIRQGLRQLGYIEGQNIVIEYRYADGRRERFDGLISDLVRLKVDLIVIAGGDAPVRSAMNATKTIPIVM
jgi:putative ABC transport system substrate-binding protein